MRQLITVGAMFAALFVACSSAPTQTAGGSSDSGNPRIMGKVANIDSSPVVNARVDLYVSSSRQDSVRRVDSTRTGDDGGFVFQSVALGAYQIVASAPDSSLIAYNANVLVEGADTAALPPVIASPASSISGTVNVFPTVSLAVTVWLKGTPFFGTVDSSGSFAMSRLPAGMYEMAALVSDSAKQTLVAALDTVTVNEGVAVSGLALRRFEPIAAGQDSMVLDDFDDGDAFNSLGGVWWSYYGDEHGTNRSQRDSAYFDVRPGTDSAGACARLSLSFDSIQYTNGGIGTWLKLDVGAYHQSADFTGVSSISFSARGTPNRVVVQAWSLFGEYVNLKTISPTSQWAHYTIDLASEMSQWDANNLARWETGKSYVVIFQFMVMHDVAGPETADLWIDNVTIHR